MPSKKKKTSKRKVARKDPPVSPRTAVLAKLTKSVSDFKLWGDVVAPEVLRTGVVSLNRAMRIGGVSAGMLGVLHGPSQGGKTLLVSEILRSVAATGGLGLFVDAECRGVDVKWFEAICGDLAEILYYKPQTFEEFVGRVQEFRAAFREAKDAGHLPETSFLGIGVDSLNRLCPANELKDLLKKKKVEGRRYPLRAMLISAWLDGIIPTLAGDEVLAVVLREGENLDAMPGQRQYRVKGGKSPIYDGGWICRITARNKVKIRKGEKVPDVIIGEKHEIEVLKNSMGPKCGELAFFYSSVGSKDGAPLGLDTPREVRDEAIERGLAKHAKRKVDGKERTGYFVDDELVAKDKPAFLAWLLEEDDGRRRYEVVADRLNGEFDER
jgi:hypothetical protein